MAKERELDILPLTRSALPIAPFHDIAEGPGLDVRIGDAVAQIFPAARTARAELAGDRARITNLTQVLVEDGSLDMHGETEDYHSTLRLDGQSLMFLKARKGQNSAVAGAVDADVLNGELPQAPAQEVSADPEGKERERVTLTGRIGYKPQFRTTPKGTVVGSFSLAVHPAPGETAWHKIVLFGARAEKLRDSGLGKGDEVEVVGYPHERERTDSKTGEVKTITEIYAAVVKKPNDKEQAEPPPTK